MWKGCAARAALFISPEAPWHAVPMLMDQEGHREPDITLQVLAQQHPSKIQASSKGQEKPNFTHHL